jgi:hypothetical protein
MLTYGPGDSHADAVAKFARGFDPVGPLTFVRHMGDDDVYLRGGDAGKSLFVIMGLWAGMPVDLAAVVRLRRVASLAGRCPSCDVCVELSTGTYRHEPGCVVTDDVLGPMLREWLRRVGPARGRRLREDPLGGAPC